MISRATMMSQEDWATETSMVQLVATVPMVVE
jgi:hypothetical protein